jgi:hypothetical protein
VIGSSKEGNLCIRSRGIYRTGEINMLINILKTKEERHCNWVLFGRASLLYRSMIRLSSLGKEDGRFSYSKAYI